MENLPASILAEFKDHGNWVVQKTTNRFSAMPVDQVHEQNNEHVLMGQLVQLRILPPSGNGWCLDQNKLDL